MSRFGCNKRIKDPSGNWELSQVLGAKVHIKSLPVSNFFCNVQGSDLYTIENIYFRISLDGKTITVVELAEFPDKIFTWRDIEIVELSTKSIYSDPATCGTFLCGKTILGNKVSLDPSYDDDVLEPGESGGIAFIY